MHIIVADDHPMYLDAVCSTLGRSFPAANIYQVSSVDELLALIVAQRIAADLVLLDLNMPGMNAGDGVSLIRAALPETMIALMSGMATLVDVQKSLSLGARGFLSKTMRPEHFSAAVTLILQGGTYIPADLLKLGEAEPSRPAALVEKGLLAALSPRETEVLKMLSSGLTNKEIGRALGLAEMTVKLHVRQILRKLDARNRAEAATIALRLGLEETPAV